jgi:hypothetical protein
MTQEERLNGMEAAVRIACKPKSEEPSYLAVAGIFPLFGTQNG